MKVEWLLSREERISCCHKISTSPESFTKNDGTLVGGNNLLFVDSEKMCKAQAEKIAEWGNETCPHDIFGEGTQCFKHACDMCWRSLSGEGE